MPENTVNFDFLMELRHKIGPLYGSEDLCVLLYSMVKREKPAVVVELGTGLGVTTAWIAAAMRENGTGTIYTVDNGEAFARMMTESWRGEKFTGRFAAPDNDYGQFLASVFAGANVAGHVKFSRQAIDLDNLGWLDVLLAAHNQDGQVPEIDILFSDYNHAPGNTVKIIGSFLPRMTEVSSIFIDSASTSLPSYWMLERLVQLFNQGRVPKELSEHLDDALQRNKLSAMVANSTFKLMHLVEKQARAQNSTAWLRTERASLLPPLALSLH